MTNDKLQVFAQGASTMLTQLGITAQVSSNAAAESGLDPHDLLVIIGLTRDLRGSVVYGMSSATGLKLASTMMGGMPVDGLNDMAKSALCEFANMASGMSVSGMSGTLVDITPPTLVAGTSMAVTLGQENIRMTEIATPLGGIDVYLGLKA